MTLVITTCTNSKRRPVPSHLHMGALPQSRSTELGAQWGARLVEGDRVALRSLYAGRGFQAAAKAADALDARLLVVSAGLGLVDADAHVPPYACTVLVGAADSVAGRATDPITPAGWWQILQSASPFSLRIRDVVEGSSGPILAALSDTYLEMVAGDLLSLQPAELKRLRLFTRAPLAHVPASLRSFVMPYDDRLDGADSPCPGPRSNFAARALSHFAETILASDDDRSAAQHQCAVITALSGWRWPEKVERRRLSDAEIMNLMEKHWDAVGGSTGRLLTLLRHDLKVSCEQSRCKVLAQLVRDARR